MIRFRIIWADGTPQTFERGDASLDVMDSGLIIATTANRTYYVPPTAYKRLEVDQS